MKTIKLISLGMILFLIMSCNTAVKFPVSDVVPSAQISATQKKDKNKNYDIKVTARHLANPNRLNPPKNYYVVWIVTENNGIKNIGQLLQKGSKKVELNTTTPFTVKEIFITAEDRGDITYPGGTEITRIKMK